jgi:hypothetical protein
MAHMPGNGGLCEESLGNIHWNDGWLADAGERHAACNKRRERLIMRKRALSTDDCHQPSIETGSTPNADLQSRRYAIARIFQETEALDFALKAGALASALQVGRIETESPWVLSCVDRSDDGSPRK